VNPDSPSNGRFPADPHHAAALYLRRGFVPVPLPARSKRPTLEKWEQLRPTAADLDTLFPPGFDGNIGLLLGEPSGNLLDADLDVDEAIAAARRLLPPTGMVSGRQSKPRSHLWYLAADVPPARAAEQFKDVDGKVLAELRSTGGQTVVAPSTHEGGEPIFWDPCGEPARVEAAELRKALARVAAAAILARHWPGEGGRHDATLAVAGGVIRAGWAVEEAEAFVRAVAEAARDSEVADRVTCVRTTGERLGKGETARGWPSLAKGLTGDGDKVVKRAREWLGLADRKKGEPKGDREGPREREDSAATRLVQLVTEVGVELFHSPEPVAYATAAHEGHTETWPLKSAGFRRWLARLFYLSEGKAPSAEAVAAALGVLEGRALFEGAEHQVFVRLAGLEGRIYLDLGDPACRVVEIDATGWRILPESPVKLIRPRGLLSLPEPQRGGSLNELRALTNVKHDDAWVLLCGFLFGAMHPTGPYALLLQVGEQGSAKSTLARQVRSLIDPNQAPLRRKPRDERDLAIAASNGWLVAFDNLSDFPDWLSDAVCCVCTGGSFGTRELYSDGEEKLFSYRRPVLIASIEDVLSRGDALDRAISLELEPIPRERRRTERAIDSQFEAVRPHVLGALLDAVAGGLRLLPEIKLDRLPRMADFALWAEACGRSSGWRPNLFLDAYERNLGEINDQALDTSAIVPVLRTHLPQEEGRTWQGTAAALLEWLNSKVAEKKPKGWPATPNSLSNTLRRLAPNLRRAGFRVEFGRVGHARVRTITLVAPEDEGKRSSASSAPPGDDEGGGTTPGTEGTCRGAPCGRPCDGPSSAGRPQGGPRPDPADSADDGRTACGQPEAERSSAPKAGTGNQLQPGYPHADDADNLLRPLSSAATGSPIGEEGWVLVRDRADLPAVLQAIDESVRVGLDVETVGLSPQRGRARLLQLATDRGVWVLDLFALGDVSDLWGPLADAEVVVHNATFDLAFLWRLGFRPGRVCDLMVLSRLLTAGTREGNALADLAARELGVTLDKSHQRDDWAASQLSPSQLEYAARDAQVTRDLYDRLNEKVRQAGMAAVAQIETRATPAFVWLAASGAPFDPAAWEALAAAAEGRERELVERLDGMAPPRDGCLSGAGAWNWNSDDQVRQCFAALGIELGSTGDEVLAGVIHPLAAALREHRSAAQMVKSFGRKWLDFAAGGRIYAGWVPLGTDAGRSACKRPNLQQVPREVAYRRCFRAPEGRVLLKADYSQLQLRIAAKIARESRMLEAYGWGEDLHTLTARQLTGKTEVTKADRQLAKAVNFGLLFGLGANGLRSYAKCEYGLDLTPEQAENYRRSFFENYPGLSRWHRCAGRSTATECRTILGRRRLLDDNTPYTHRLNSPVQGSEADGAKQAMALLWERRGQCPGAFPVLFVHDEIVVEADEGQAEVAGAWLKGAMVDGMREVLAPVPCEVEVKVGQTWEG
jgi:DNA polymerase-1